MISMAEAINIRVQVDGFDEYNKLVQKGQQLMAEWPETEAVYVSLMQRLKEQGTLAYTQGFIAGHDTLSWPEGLFEHVNKILNTVLAEQARDYEKYLNNVHRYCGFSKCLRHIWQVAVAEEFTDSMIDFMPLSWDFVEEKASQQIKGWRITQPVMGESAWKFFVDWEIVATRSMFEYFFHQGFDDGRRSLNVVSSETPVDGL